MITRILVALALCTVSWGAGCGPPAYNPLTGEFNCSGTAGSATGTVTTLSITTANGVSGSVANPTTTPAITIVLGAIAPTTVDKVTITTPATGSTLTILDGKTLTDTSAIGAVPLVGATGGGFAAAVVGDLTGLFGSCSGSQLLGFDGICHTAGAGTVTVVGAGSVCSTCILTGGGTTTIQAPNSSATVDSSGNVVTPGTVTSGSGSASAGGYAFKQGTANTAPTSSVGFQAPASVTTKFFMNLPAAPITGLLLNTGTTDPSTISFVAGAANKVIGGTTPSAITITSSYVDASIGVTGTALSQFAATTSAQLAGVISDETGSGLLVFATSPTLTTPNIGVATATSVNKVAITAPTTSATLVIPDGTTATLQGTDTYVGRATTDTLTNKTYDTGGTGNTFKIAGTSITAVSGTGAVCLATGSACSSGGGATGTSVTSTTPVTVQANSTSDQQLMELSLGAGYFNSSKQPFLFDGAGVYSTQAAQTPTITLKAKLCTVSGCGSGTVVTLISIVSTATVAAVTNNNWNLAVLGYTATTGASGNLEIHGPLMVDLGALTTTADSVFVDTNTAVSSNIDLTAALFLDFTVAFSTQPGATFNSFTQRSGGVMPFAATAAPVTSFSGDTTLLSNSLSTGAVTTTLANAAANTLWGNNTGGSAAPGYQTSFSISGAGTAARFIPNSSTIPTDGLYLPAANSSGIADNSQPVLKTIGVASAVDFFNITNAATASPATLTVAGAGTDSNVSVNITSKGTGTIQHNGGFVAYTVATADDSAKTANITATTLVTPTVDTFYTMGCEVIVTTFGSTATVPACNVVFNDAENNTAQTLAVTGTATGSAAKIGLASGGQLSLFKAKANVAVQYSTSGYASTGTAMQYAIHVNLNQVR